MTQLHLKLGLHWFTSAGKQHPSPKLELFPGQTETVHLGAKTLSFDLNWAELVAFESIISEANIHKGDDITHTKKTVRRGGVPHQIPASLESRMNFDRDSHPSWMIFGVTKSPLEPFGDHCFFPLRLGPPVVPFYRFFFAGRVPLLK